jgi:hypothetical protein
MGAEVVGAEAGAPPDVPAPAAGVPDELLDAVPEEGDADAPVLDGEAGLAGVAELPLPDGADEPEAAPDGAVWVGRPPPVPPPGVPGPADVRPWP